MRALRWSAALTLTGALLVLGPSALADGGAFFQLDRTFYRGGSTARVETYVWVPASRQRVFDRGPFYAYLLPAGRWLTEGEPLPASAVRIGAFDVEKVDRRVFELSGSFAVPELDGGTYDLQLCNDPCTVSGFREPLTGVLTIAGTDAEVSLLRRNAGLQSRAAGLRHRLHKLERANRNLQDAWRDALAERDAARAGVAALRSSVTAPGAGVAASSADAWRPLVDAWALVAIGGAALAALTSVALAVALGRRSAQAATRTIAARSAAGGDLARR